MEELSNLVIQVDSKGVATADKRLAHLERTSGKTERATDRLVGTFKRLVTAAAALAVLKKSADLIGGFEESMSQVRAISGATEEQFTSLSATARQLGADTRYSAREAADGMKFLAQAGFNTNQVIAAMPGTLDLATAGALDLAAAADISSNILSGFNMEAAESGRVADILAMTASNANTNVYQLGDGMKYVAPIAAGMNISIEETAAAIGTLSNAGLQGSMAGTGLRRVLSSLAGPTSEAADVLRAYGVSLDEVNPATRDLTDIIDRLAVAGISAGDALTIFGDRGAPAMLALVSQREKLKELNGMMNDSAGAAKRMAEIMGDNLPGDLKQLRSAIEELVLIGGDRGLKGMFRGGVQEATQFTRAMNDVAASGELGEWIDLIQMKLGLLTDGFTNAAFSITEVLETTFAYWSEDGKSTVDSIIDAFSYMPENIRAFVELSGTSFGFFVEYAEAAGKGIYERIAAYFGLLVDVAANYGKEIFSHLNPFADDFDFTGAQIKTFESFATRVVNSWNAEIGKKTSAYDAFEEEVTAILNERDINIAASDAKVAGIERLRESYKKLKADRIAASEAEGGAVGSPGIAPSSSDQERFLTKEFDDLRKQLQLEEKTVQESYERRLELIYKNTEEGGAARLELERELNERVAIEMDQASEATMSRLDAQHQAEQEELRTALDNRLITEQEYQEKSKAAWVEYTEALTNVSSSGRAAVATMQLEMYSMVFGYASDISSQLSGLVSENQGAAKAMFIASKAIAIAQAIVNTELAATAALTAGPILGVPASVMIRALGYASVGVMAASSVAEYGGKFEHGGMIGAGQFGIVGEAGAELVKGPAVVTSARSTADLSGQALKTNVQVNINNQVGGEAEVVERETPDGKIIDILIKRTKREIAKDISGGGDPVSNSLERAYKLRRGLG